MRLDTRNDLGTCVQVPLQISAVMLAEATFPCALEIAVAFGRSPSAYTFQRRLGKV